MESFNLDIIPRGTMPACHSSQFDVNRTIRVYLLDNGQEYTLDGTETVTLSVRKPDNTVITDNLSIGANNYVDFNTSEQMTAIVGQSICEIRIEKGETNIGTLNFVLEVEKDPLSSGIHSESVITDLQAQVDEAVAVSMNNYYTKSETDALLSQKADESELLNILPTDTASGAVASFTDGADNVPVKALSVEFAATQAEGTPTPSTPIPIVGVDKVNVSRTGKNLLNETQDIKQYLTDNTVHFIPVDLPKNTVMTYSDDYGNWRGSGKFLVLTTASNSSEFATADKIYLISSDIANRDSFTFTSLGKQMYLRFYGNQAFYDFCSYMQLELGSTATEYEPYNGTTALINLGGTYYGGEVNKDGNINDNKDKIVIDGSQTISVALQAYIKEDACDGFITVNSIYPQLYPLAQPDNFAYCDKLKPVKQTVWNTVGYPNCMTINSNQIHLNIANDLLGVTDYTQETTATAKAKIQSFLQNNPITVIFSKAPATAQASNAIELNTLYGVNNFFSDAGDVDVTIRADIALYIQKMLGGNANRSLGANPSILRTGAISTDIELREPDSEPVELEGEVTEQPENEGNDNEDR